MIALSNIFAKKTYIWIMVFLLILITAAFFITYSTYVALLENDFLEKQVFLSDQTAYALGRYLASLEEQVILFMNRNDLPEKLQNRATSVYELRFDTLDFFRFQIYSTSESVAKWRTNEDITSFPGLPVSEVQQFLEQDHSAWHSVPVEVNSSSKPYLAYFQKILVNEQTVGYLVAWVEPSAIERVLSLYMNDYSVSSNELFSSYTAALIKVGSHYYPCGNQSLDSELLHNISEAPLLLNGKYITRSDAGMQNISLVLLGDAEKLWDTLHFIRQSFFYTYLIVILLLSFCLYFFVRKIDTSIKDLFSKLDVESQGGMNHAGQKQ